jgi:predicted MFS family arabinose efflux permease
VTGLARKLGHLLGFERSLILFLGAVILIGAGEETWMRFVPKYLEVLGAAAGVIGLYDAIKTFLGAVYAYPGGVMVDRWGHRRALVGFTALSMAGYAVVLWLPRWEAVVGGMFLFLAWSSLSLPAMFSLVASHLGKEKHTMGIGIQSLTKRIPIVLGPIGGGLLIDRYGFVAGVRVGLGISIFLGLLAIWLQSRLQEDRPPEHAGPTTRGNFLTAVRGFDPRMRRLLFSDILIRFCERIPYAWVVIYAVDHAGVSATEVGVLIAVETVVAMACYVPSAHLADRYGKEPFVIVTFLFFTVFPLTLLAAHNFKTLLIAFAVRGLKEFGDSARKALLIEYSGATSRGRSIGAYYLIRDVIVSFGALLGAWLWKFGSEVNFLSAAAIGALGTAGYIMSRETKPAKSQ